MPTDNTVPKVDTLVADALDKSGVESGTVLIVAVSGGPDSLALLYSLWRIAQTRNIRLHGAHLDHRLRGPASDADAAFVAQTFERLCIPYTLEKAEAAEKRRRENLSIEDAARRLRHKFFAQVAADQGTDAVTLGHTMDDQAETVLLHLVRGAGLTGLRGMSHVSDMDVYGRNLILIRPLLGVTRKETAEFCRRIGVEPRVDETNFSTRLTRNRIRLELLPLMEQINPAVKDSLVRLSRSVAVDLAFLEGEIDDVLDSTMRLTDGVASINRERFLALHPSIRNHLIRRAFLLVRNDMVDLRQSHVEEIVRLISGSAGTVLDLSGGLRFAVSYEEATLGPERQPTCKLPPFVDETTIQIPGETHLEGWRITTRLAETKDPPQGGFNDGSRFFQSFDFDSLGGGRLVLRGRVPGDRFQPLGMAHAKKLQDFMVDERIPREWRDSVPLLVSHRGIAWVVGWRVAHWARLREDTQKALQVEFEAIDIA